MEYRIIEECSPEGMAEKVNEAIKEGWKPQGGVAIAYSWRGDCAYYKYFYQAMIKDSSENKSLKGRK